MTATRNNSLEFVTVEHLLLPLTNVDGLKNGMWIKYYENGNKKSQVRYVNGKKEGMATYWNNDGIKTKEESYKNDLIDDKTTSFTWYQGGKLLDKIAIKS